MAEAQALPMIGSPLARRHLQRHCVEEEGENTVEAAAAADIGGKPDFEFSTGETRSVLCEAVEIGE